MNKKTEDVQRLIKLLEGGNFKEFVFAGVNATEEDENITILTSSKSRLKIFGMMHHLDKVVKADYVFDKVIPIE